MLAGNLLCKFRQAWNFGLNKSVMLVDNVIDKVGEGFKITGIKLNCEAKVPGVDAGKFQEIANATKAGCPVSQALSAVPIELSAKLV